MSDRTSNESIPPEWLAAYADGELDHESRDCVANWLAEHPEALAELEEQQDLAHRDFRNAIAPTMPAQTSWDHVFSNIENTLAGAMRREARLRRLAYLVPGVALASFAAALLVAFLAIDRQRPHDQRSQPTISLDGDDGVVKGRMAFLDDGEDFVFRVATTDDVELIHLPESAAELLVVGKHPLADIVLLLAQATDVQLLNYGPDDQGNLPDIQTTQGPDASMLWAPSLKP